MEERRQPRDGLDGRRQLADRGERAAGHEQRRGGGAGGSWLIGKNVRLNRNSGVMTKRKMIENDVSRSRVAVHAAIGIPKASPVRTAVGQARIVVQPVHAPKKSIVIRNA